MKTCLVFDRRLGIDPKVEQLPSCPGPESRGPSSVEEGVLSNRKRLGRPDTVDASTQLFDLECDRVLRAGTGTRAKASEFADDKLALFVLYVHLREHKFVRTYSSAEPTREAAAAPEPRRLLLEIEVKSRRAPPNANVSVSRADHSLPLHLFDSVRHRRREQSARLTLRKRSRFEGDELRLFASPDIYVDARISRDFDRGVWIIGPGPRVWRPGDEGWRGNSRGRGRGLRLRV